ncbi:tetratricopeptide repeat protein [Pseudenhygromyxa sp. WMMC2535]|uniref:tetratricopeptide repeat protein n=1 Tax=Pseudenhygromyxa sp. WMMC2535 TaxID=2712867 RepID=UPI0015526564|nr:tetratricopeptide repeat protein [Pseudenhygromyxa sp. WMMC2535]NVB42218.1 tetratricopeptide repeat protein [Pseudenhygromyxa sp. WMMC2535]
MSRRRRSDLELRGEMFTTRHSGVGRPIEEEISGAIDLSDLLDQVERGEGGEQAPPALVDSPSLLWGVHSGLHSSLMSTAVPMGTADAWQLLAEEFAEESREVGDPLLGAALMAEAGRILVDRLGRREDGQLLLRDSGSAVAKTLLELRPSGDDSVAEALAELEQAGSDPKRDPEERAAAWVEFGLLCEESMGNRKRALDAYREALACQADHPEALLLSAEAAAITNDVAAGREALGRRLDTCESARERVWLLLELSELSEDPDERLRLVQQAHDADPREETALRRLIRLVATTGDSVRLGKLYRQLADVAEDPLSASTALHLAFLTLAESNEPFDSLVRELAAREPRVSDGSDMLAPLSEVALYIEQRVASGDAEGLPANLHILDRVAQTLDAPREQALVREQMARLRRETLRRLVDENPDPADTVTGLPKLSEDRKDLVRALETDLRFCLVNLPEHRWVREALAELLEYTGDHAGLVLHLDEWARTVTAGPGRAAILLRLGAVHENLRQDLPRAAEIYELSVAEDPENPACLRALGRVYEKMRRWPQAVANLQRQADETEDGPERLAALRRVAAMAQHELEDVDLAIATLEEVTRIDPDDLLSLFQLAALCRAEGRTPVLVTTLQHLVERLDDDVSRTSVLVELGEALELQLKRRDAAREAYERALRLTPGYTPALRALARLYRDNGDLDALLGLHEPDVDSVTDPAVLALKAARVCLDELQDHDRAIDYLRRAYETNPDLLPARELLQQLLTVNNRIEEAYDLLRAQDLPEPAPLLADYHYRLGLLAEALARQAAQVGGASKRKLEQAAARFDAALQHYRAALGVQPNHGLAAERSRRLLVAHHDHDNLVRLVEALSEHVEGPSQTALLTQLARLQATRPGTKLRRNAEAAQAARRTYERALQRAPNDPVLRREFETLLRFIEDRQTLPSIYLQTARASEDLHFKATLLVEAAELLLAEGGADEGETPDPVRVAEDRQLAATAILEALHADPGNPYAVRHLERLLSEPNPPLRALDAVSARAVRAQSDAERAIFYLESAELLEHAGAVDPARRAYQAALEALPGLQPAALGLARLEKARSGKLPQAAAEAPTVSLHNLMAEARDAAVRAGASGDPSEAAKAIDILTGILDRDPGHRDALGLARGLANQLDDPRPALELITRVFPRVQHRETRYDLALLLAEHALELETAVRYLEDAVEANPEGKQALHELVRCHRQLGRDREAVETTERLLELYEIGEPSAIDLRMGIAASLGNDPTTLERASSHARVVLDARPEDPRAVTLMADLLERSLQRVEAAKLLDRLRARERDRGKLHDINLRQARLFAASHGHDADALAAAERAVQLNPGHRETVALLTTLLARSGQSERLGRYLPAIRGAMIHKISRAALSLRDLQLLTRISRKHSPQLSATAEAVAYAIDPSSGPPPTEHLRPATSAGLQAVLGTPQHRDLLLASNELAELHELLSAVDPVLPRMASDFQVLSEVDAQPIPASADATSFSVLLGRWAVTVAIPTPTMVASGTHNACVLLPGDPPTLRLGANLWMQGDMQSWRGLAAVALARRAWGGALVRALPAIDMDLLLATCFESVRVFNAITADPDARRLQELSAQLGKHLPRRNRKLIERACESLSGYEFAPSATARATLASDLRLAALLSGDIGGVLAAACILDGVAGGPLKQRINRSKAAQALLAFVLGDDYLRLRKIVL